MCVALISKKTTIYNLRCNVSFQTQHAFGIIWHFFAKRGKIKKCSDLDNQTIELILQSSALSQSEIDIHLQYWGCGWAHDDYHVEYSLNDATFFFFSKKDTEASLRICLDIWTSPFSSIHL